MPTTNIEVTVLIYISHQNQDCIIYIYNLDFDVIYKLRRSPHLSVSAMSLDSTTRLKENTTILGGILLSEGPSYAPSESEANYAVMDSWPHAITRIDLTIFYCQHSHWRH